MLLMQPPVDVEHDFDLDPSLQRPLTYACRGAKVRTYDLHLYTTQGSAPLLAGRAKKLIVSLGPPLFASSRRRWLVF